MSTHREIIRHFHARLMAAVNRSALLRVRTSQTGRLVDCSRLAVVDDTLPRRVLEAVVDGESPVCIDFRMRPPLTDDDLETKTDEERQQIIRALGQVAQQHRQLYDNLTGACVGSQSSQKGTQAFTAFG
jgi:hypothetical protein